MKPREPRRKVLINARMRCGASWSDACILNLSKRGMLVQSPEAPSRGSYLEIRRGSHVIVARVVWANSNRFGIRSQDDIPAEELIEDRAKPASAQGAGALPGYERRTRPRTNQPHDASRWRSRSMEFAGLAIAGSAAAYLVFGAVSESLGRPIAAVSQALSGSKRADVPSRAVHAARP